MSDERLEREQVAFLEQHKNADELVFGVGSGICLGAVYLSPKEKMVQRPLRTFFKAIQDAETISEDVELRGEKRWPNWPNWPIWP